MKWMKRIIRESMEKEMKWGCSSGSATHHNWLIWALNNLIGKSGELIGWRTCGENVKMVSPVLQWHVQRRIQQYPKTSIITLSIFPSFPRRYLNGPNPILTHFIYLFIYLNCKRKGHLQSIYQLAIKFCPYVTPPSGATHFTTLVSLWHKKKCPKQLLWKWV